MRMLMTGDTHIPDRARHLPAELLEQVNRADLVLHTGDFNSKDTYARLLDASRTLHAVRGNRDRGSLAAELPEELHLDLEGMRVVLLHGHSFGRPRPSRLARHYADTADIIIYGHLHRPFVARFTTCTVMNPGAPTEPRGSRPSFMLAELRDGQMDVETVYIKEPSS